MFSRIKAIILEHLYRLFRSPDEWIDTFFWPLLDTVIWGFTTLYFSRLGQSAASAASFLFGGLILWTIIWRAQQEISISLMADIWNQNLINLFASPLSCWEYLFGIVTLGFLKVFLTLGAVATLALVVYSFNLFNFGFYLLPFFGILLLFAWSVGIFVNGLIIRYGRRVQFLAWSIIGLLNPLCCVYYPLSSLPKSLQHLSVFIPATYVFEAARMILVRKTPETVYFVFGFILAIIWLILSVIFFNFFYEKSRQKGTLAKIEG